MIKEGLPNFRESLISKDRQIGNIFPPPHVSFWFISNFRLPNKKVRYFCEFLYWIHILFFIFTLGNIEISVIPVKAPHTSDDRPITVHITCERAEEWGTLITESHTHSNILLLNLDFPTRLHSRRNPNSPDLTVASSHIAMDSEWPSFIIFNYDHLLGSSFN